MFTSIREGLAIVSMEAKNEQNVIVLCIASQEQKCAHAVSWRVYDLGRCCWLVVSSFAVFLFNPMPDLE